MEKTSVLLTSVALLLSACGNNGVSTGKETEADSTADVVVTQDIQGKWQIENIVACDSIGAQTSETKPESVQYMNFNNDGTFWVATNCNTISGEYTRNGDSILFSNIVITEMACDDMEIEQQLLRIMPIVKTIDCANDSIILLNSTSAAHIVLKKAPVKTNQV